MPATRTAPLRPASPPRFTLGGHTSQRELVALSVLLCP
jgi:hypothetical protein